MFTTTFRRSLMARQIFAARTSIARPISQSPYLAARKDAQGKDDMKIEPNEISKSGSDTEANAVEDAAFSKDKTRPEEQMKSAEGESKEQGEKMNNPLDVSPANHEVSHTRDAQEGGAEGSPSQQGFGDRERTSGGSGADKSTKSGTGKKFE